jgi:hypothetical protein
MNHIVANPRTYNDDLLNERSRRVFMKALTAAEELLDGEKQPFNPERVHALAALADAAACGFKDEEQEDEYA